VKYFIGIDPDLHSLFTALVTTDDNGGSPRLYGVRTTKAKGDKNEDAVVRILSAYHKPESPDAGYTQVAIESQKALRNSARPQDLIHLAQVAGGLVSAWRGTPITLVPPQEWKGTVPKHIKQARVLTALGIQYALCGGNTQYAVPVDWQKYDLDGKMTAGDWIDAADSVGLALWAAEYYFKQARLTSYRVK